MGKTRTIYSCQSCGYQCLKWLGKCPECGEWNSLVEEVPARGTNSPGTRRPLLGESFPQPLTEISMDREERLFSGIGEFDRVLGGGIVPGSIVLIGGDPGIGKSTLLLQAFERLTESGRTALYISGEESARQTKMRAERLGISSRNLLVQTETSLETIMASINEVKPCAVAIDSIQTIFSTELESAPGTISQVRESSSKLMCLAKSMGPSVFLIGHVTKEGAIAGPRVLEHMVDTVLYFEGDRGHPYRILRSVKNRFGSTNEIGVFEMKDSGLAEIVSPSELFLAERPLNVPGSVVAACMEGSRPLLVELQVLACHTNFGTPRRTSLGVDYNRVTLLIAVLEKKAGLNFFDQDVFVNVAGGVRVEEPAVDLAVIVAAASSLRNRPVDPGIVAFGEVGLAGEVRAVSQAEMRIKEASKMGFSTCLMPQNNINRISIDCGDMKLVGVNSIEDALEAYEGVD
ncbi:MAG: DNA repair protein RadA [Deltaproteobacteria bacterium]|nr:DNA repair protein RadA [Deltaproteobacteria bacterium]